MAARPPSLFEIEADIEYFEKVLETCKHLSSAAVETRKRLELLYEAKRKYMELRDGHK